MEQVQCHGRRLTMGMDIQGLRIWPWPIAGRPLQAPWGAMVADTMLDCPSRLVPTGVTVHGIPYIQRTPLDQVHAHDPETSPGPSPPGSRRPFCRNQPRVALSSLGAPLRRPLEPVLETSDGERACAMSTDLQGRLAPPDLGTRIDELGRSPDRWKRRPRSEGTGARPQAPAAQDPPL